MLYRVIILCCFSFFITDSIYGQRPSANQVKVAPVANEDDKRYLKIESSFDVLSKVFKMSWDNCSAFYGIRFIPYDGIGSTYTIPLGIEDYVESEFKRIEVILDLDTDVILPDNDYNVYILYDEFINMELSEYVQFNKQSN